jgi:hypothetical protein
MARDLLRSVLLFLCAASFRRKRGRIAALLQSQTVHDLWIACQWDGARGINASVSS